MQTRIEHLPETPEELTAQWLGEALDLPISAVEQRELGEGKGFMGDVLRISLTSDAPDAPTSVIAKLPKMANRGMGELIGVYEREIMFFRAFGDNMPVRIPELLYSEFDRDKGSENQESILRALDKMPNFLQGLVGILGTKVAQRKNRRYMLLIEDLSHMEAADQLQGLDEKRCGDVLCAIAPMHKHFWGGTGLDGHFWLLPLDVDARLRHARFKQSRQSYGEIMGPELASTLDWLVPNGEPLMRQFFTDAPTTLMHCDLRLDNVMFDGEDDCAFIDWQLVRKGPAAYDVAYFLSGSLPEAADDETVMRILSRYHKALDVADYSFEMLVRDYRRATLLHLAALSGAAEVDLGNERGDMMMAAWMRRLAARARTIDPTSVMA